MIINRQITEAIKILKCFSIEGQKYWIELLNISINDRAFIKIYLGLCKTL